VQGTPNQALEQTRDSVLRYGESVGCELLNFFVRSWRAEDSPVDRWLVWSEEQPAVAVRFRDRAHVAWVARRCRPVTGTT
jgi:hypothetical protein